MPIEIEVSHMDVERIQRINNLALDLLKQGLAVNRDDAIAQAEIVFRGDKGTEEYNELRQTINKVETHKQNQYNPAP